MNSVIIVTIVHFSMTERHELIILNDIHNMQKIEYKLKWMLQHYCILWLWSATVFFAKLIKLSLPTLPLVAAFL